MQTRHLRSQLSQPSELRLRLVRFAQNSILLRCFLRRVVATVVVTTIMQPVFVHPAFTRSFILEKRATSNPKTKSNVAPSSSPCRVSNDSIRRFKVAASAARSALEKLKLVSDPAKADADAINGALKKATIDDAMPGQFSQAAATLDNGVNSKDGRFAPLKSPSDAMATKSKALDQAYASFKTCENDSEASDAVKVVLADYKALNSDIQDQLKVGKQLATAVQAIPVKLKDLLAVTQASGQDGLAGKVKSLAALLDTLTPQTLRTELAKRLPDLALGLRLRRTLPIISDRLTDALDPSKHSDLQNVVTKPDFQSSLKDLTDQLTAALKKVPGWAKQSAEAARQEQIASQAALLQAGRDPFHQANEALTRAAVTDVASKDFGKLAAPFQEALLETQREDVPKGVLPADFLSLRIKEISDNLTLLQVLTARLARTAQQLNGDLPVDKSTWTMASVDLFYFDNVERLIRVLSPTARYIGGREDLQREAKTARDTLQRASQDLSNADAAVTDARDRVATLEEQLRQAQISTKNAIEQQRREIAAAKDTAREAKENSRVLTARRERADTLKTQAQTRFNDVDAEAKAKPTDAAAQARRETARQTLEQAELDASDAKSAEGKASKDAEDANTAATEAATAHSQEIADLKQQVTDAKNDLKAAITKRGEVAGAQRTAIKDAFLAAQVENFAFAAARDNAPFLTNLPEPARPAPAVSGPAAPANPPTSPVTYPESDPISHVLLFAFPDSKNIFIRGPRDDIDLVRQIIKEFDQPEGQAMMTLRTIEVSSDGTKGGANRALKFLSKMDEDVDGAQTQVETAISALRDEINKQVAVAISSYTSMLQNQLAPLNQRLAAATPAQQALLQRQIDSINSRLTRRPEEIESIAFYEPQVLASLGWRDELIDRLADTRFLNAVIPRPSRTVTLAQALIVLSLATNGNRKAVLEGTKKLVAQPRDNDQKVVDPFFSLRRFIGEEGDSADILGFQTKLIGALRFNGITHVLEGTEALVRADLGLKQAKAEGQQRMQEYQASTIAGMIELDFSKLRLVEMRDLNLELARLDSVGVAIKSNLDAMLGWLQGSGPNADPVSLRQRIERTIKDDNGTSLLLLEAVGLRRSARFRFSQANESAVNLTFRRYLEQVHRDLNDVYVKPAFRRLNERLLKEHLGTGVLQETSILASNRLGARVDPRGSAQLAVGEEQNLLEAARQLTNLLGVAGKSFATGITGNPLSLAGGPAAPAFSTLSGAQSVLNSLDQLPRNDRPTIYGIATGNLFQVTPIIDPSGQALRFKFDFVSATQIREPENTIDPQLPRIERHSVNTEVHLANQEIRLISQFQANSRLGLPTRKSGGIPILRYIPYLNEVPLIGWFVRRGGRAAQTQQSLIFCQTAMYPTLSEVLDLAVQSPTFTGFEN